MEATVRSVGMMPENGSLFFCAVVDYGDEMMNVKAKIEFSKFEPMLFLEELRDKIAEGFDIHTWDVNMSNDTIIAKIAMWEERFRRMGVIG